MKRTREARRFAEAMKDDEPLELDRVLLGALKRIVEGMADGTDTVVIGSATSIEVSAVRDRGRGAVTIEIGDSGAALLSPARVRDFIEALTAAAVDAWGPEVEPGP
jgi:hypothetical protein